MNDELKNQIIVEISVTADDINQYLQSNVPIECYGRDINFKFEQLIERVKALFPVNEEAATNS